MHLKDKTIYIICVAFCDLLPFGKSAERSHQSKTGCHGIAFLSHPWVQPTMLTMAKMLLLSQPSPPPPPPPCPGPSGVSDDSDNPEPTYCKLGEKLSFSILATKATHAARRICFLKLYSPASGHFLFGVTFITVSCHRPLWVMARCATQLCLSKSQLWRTTWNCQCCPAKSTYIIRQMESYFL